MKKILLISIFIVLLLIGMVVWGVYLLYLRNARVGVSSDYRASQYLQEKPAPLQNNLIVKVVTFNIQDLWVVGRNRPARMRHIARVLETLDPDIVGFQEAFITKERELLINHLGKTRLHHHQYFPSGLVGSGLLISSAWPIKEVLFHRYMASGPARRVWEGDFWAGKGVALARIETPVGMLDFFNTHAQAGYGRAEYREIRRRQMTELAAFINLSKTGNSPALLVGDMNCRPGAVDYETAVKEAALIRAMTIESGIDHIFFVDNTRYTVETLETTRIEKTITEEGKTFTLSDHAGFMSTIRIVPI